MAKWEDNAKKRIESNVEKYADIIRRAEQEGFKEGDTSAIVRDMLGEMLGYDKFFDVTSEYQIKGHFADYGVKIDGELRFLIETKAIGTVLGKRDLFQLISYSANEGVGWGVLTNARVWRCYHLEPGRKADLVFQVDFLQPLDKKIENLFWLTKEGIMYCGALPKIYGSHRTNAEKRQAVRFLLQNEEWAQWSGEEIARKAGVSSGFVGKMRVKMQAEELAKAAEEGIDPKTVVRTKRECTRRGKKYVMDISRIGRKKEDAQEQSEATSEETDGETGANEVGILEDVEIKA